MVNLTPLPRCYLSHLTLDRPLFLLQKAVSSVFSANSTSYTQRFLPFQAKSRHKSSFRGRQSSVYIKRSRWSRYKNAAATTLPIRLTDTPSDQIPIDNIGCCSSTSFFWTRKFLRDGREIEGEESNIPDASKFDGAEVNAKRLLGKFKDNFQRYGSAKCSMFKVVFQFCSTRIIIATIFHLFAVVFEILGPVMTFEDKL